MRLAAVVEYALWGNASFRADVLAVGELDPAAAGAGRQRDQVPRWPGLALRLTPL